MKPQNILLIVCLILSFSGAAQSNEFASKNTSCDSIYQDSLFCKSYVQSWIDSFQVIFGQDFHVTFRKDHINRLHSTLKDTTHVRIFFMLPKNKTQMPGAVLVPYSRNDCGVDLTGDVIVADGGGYKAGTGPIADSIRIGIGNWSAQSKSLKTNHQLTEVYAYNFSWPHIMEACHKADYDLAVAFGISSVDDGDSGNCIHMYLTEGDAVNSKNQLYLDFSKPCPQLCGGDLGKNQ